MTPLVLDALAAARAERRTAVLATRLEDGLQFLLLDRDGRLRHAGASPSPVDRGFLDAITDLAADAAASERTGIVRCGDADWFLHVHVPPPRLLLVGAVHIAQLLAPLARATGFSVHVVDPRESFATEARFPGTALSTLWPDKALQALAVDRHSAVVVLTHDPKLDDPALELALRSPAFYVGALGSGRTQASRRTRLLQSGLDAEAIARLRGPVGLPIGALGPAEIAVSILAEIVAVRRDGRLADRSTWPVRPQAA